MSKWGRPRLDTCQKRCPKRDVFDWTRVDKFKCSIPRLMAGGYFASLNIQKFYDKFLFGGDIVSDCIFCNLDFDKIENTIIYETENFFVIPTVGALVDGYVLIVTKEHMNSLAELNDEQKREYQELVIKVSDI